MTAKNKIKPKEIVVKFNGLICTVDFRNYENGRIAIWLTVKRTGEDAAVATVNIPNFPLKDDEVIIKNYSENEGILDVLIQAGVVSESFDKADSGYISADVCKLLYSKLNYDLNRKLAMFKGDMESLLQYQLFRCFGLRLNTNAFEQLATFVPRSVIRKHRGSMIDLEAILLGQAGLLPIIGIDGYCAEWLYRYEIFKAKYNLETMPPNTWQFKGVKRSDYPSVRISQLAMLLHRERFLFEKCLNLQTDIEEIRPLLVVPTSDYWEDHCHFGIYTNKQVKQLAEDVANSIITDGIAPVRELLRS